jgi:hypothetical protein
MELSISVKLGAARRIAVKGNAAVEVLEVLLWTTFLIFTWPFDGVGVGVAVGVGVGVGGGAPESSE